MRLLLLWLWAPFLERPRELGKIIAKSLGPRKGKQVMDSSTQCLFQGCSKVSQTLGGRTVLPWLPGISMLI